MDTIDANTLKYICGGYYNSDSFSISTGNNGELYPGLEGPLNYHTQTQNLPSELSSLVVDESTQPTQPLIAPGHQKSIHKQK